MAKIIAPTSGDISRAVITSLVDSNGNPPVGVTLPVSMAGDFNFNGSASSYSYSITLTFENNTTTTLTGTIVGDNITTTSYNTIAMANNYFSNRLFANQWYLTAASIQQQALNQSKLIIDRFAYVGMKYGDSVNPRIPQTNMWPRNWVIVEGYVIDPQVIPDDILGAECEIALALVKGIDPEEELRAARIISRSFGTVRTTYDSKVVPEHILNGVPSATAWSMMFPYFDRAANRNVIQRRVS